MLVANAALPASGELDSFTPEEIDRALAVNLRAPIQLARLLIEPLAARRDGHLVFVGSLSGKSAGPHSSLYSATKFGLRGFALSLRQDLAAHGVGVSLVSPGLRPRRGDVRRLRRAAPARRRDEHAGGRRRRRRPRDRGATAPRSTWRRSRCAPARASPASRPV